MTWHPETLTGPSAGDQSSATKWVDQSWEPLKGLSATHYNMIRQHVQGIPISRIVMNFKRYGVNYSSRHIKRVISCRQGQEYASLYSAHFHGGTVDLVEAGRDHTPEIIHTELSIMQNPEVRENHRLSAAQDLLDRLGPPKISRQESEHRTPTTINIQINASQMSQFLAPPPIIEAEVIQLLENPSSAED